MRDIPKFDSREIGQNLRSLMKQHDMTVKDFPVRKQFTTG